MRTFRNIGAVAAGCAAASALSFSPAHAAGGFAGTWTAVDDDESNLTLFVHGARSRFAVRYVDDMASQACGGAPASASGAGLVVGDELAVRAALVCTPGGNLFRHHIELTFTLSGNTLTDNFGIVWTRAG